MADTLKKLLFFIILFNLLAFPAFSQDTAAASPNPSFGMEADFNSRYVWRGLAWSRGAVLQPSAWLDFQDLSFSVWGNYDSNQENATPGFNEFDFQMDYQKQINKFTLTPSVNYWTYPTQEDAPSTGEISLKLAYPMGDFNLWGRQAFDYVKYQSSNFSDAGLGFDKELSPKLSLSAGLIAGWGSPFFNETYLGLKKSAWNYGGVNLSFTYYPSEGFYFRPHTELTFLPDPELRQLVEKPALWNVGLAMGKEF